MVSSGISEWIHSCIFERKGEGEITELGVSSRHTHRRAHAHGHRCPQSSSSMNKPLAQVHTCVYI